MQVCFNFSKAYFDERLKRSSFRTMMSFLLLITLLFPCLSISLLDEYFMQKPPAEMLGVDGEFTGAKFDFSRHGAHIHGLKFYIGDSVYIAHDYVIDGDIREMRDKLNSELMGKTYSIYYREKGLGKNEVLGLYSYGNMYIEPEFAVNGFHEMATYWLRFSLLWMISGLIVAVFASGMIQIKRTHS